MSSPSAAEAAVPADPWRIIRWRGRHPAYREVLAPDVALTMLRMPAGSGLMGAPEEEEGSSTEERPIHRVEVAEFLMGQTPVTQAQWRVVAQWPPIEGNTRWARELDPDPVSKLDDAERFLGDQRPVVNVGWHEAMEFGYRLRLRTGKHYTLPTEAQWEYACRAGTTSPFHYGATLSTDLANYNGDFSYGDSPKGENRQQTTNVASFPANAWGLQDMHGNVWEWCADHWHDNYNNAPTDSRLVLEKTLSPTAQRVIRGGSWDEHPKSCRSASRNWYLPHNHDDDIGFRVCCLPQNATVDT